MLSRSYSVHTYESTSVRLFRAEAGERQDRRHPVRHSSQYVQASDSAVQYSVPALHRIYIELRTLHSNWQSAIYMHKVKTIALAN